MAAGIAAVLVVVDTAEVSADTAAWVAQVCTLVCWVGVCMQAWLVPEVCIGASVVQACTEVFVAVACIVASGALEEVHM